MSKQRINFSGEVWNKMPIWKQALILVPFYSLLFINPFLKSLGDSIKWLTLSIEISWVVIVVAFLIYSLVRFRSNSFHYMKGSLFRMKIGGKKIEMDAAYINFVELREYQLEIVRINRLDTFDVSEIRSQDIEKLIALINEKRGVGDSQILST